MLDFKAESTGKPNLWVLGTQAPADFIFQLMVNVFNW